MGPTPEQIELIKQYEPALFFVGTPGSPYSERFFPSDAKRYLEKAALYRINAKDETKAQWGDSILGAGSIGALAGEEGTFLGSPDTSTPPKYQYLETDPNAVPAKELFLDVAGWRTGNQFADLDHMAALYAGDLKDSQYRYHAEFFDATRLRQLFDNPHVDIYFALFDPRPGKPPVLTDPALICYYLFYPGHEESLAGCTDVDGDPLESARDFGSFAGEWSCIALLLDRANSSQPYAPKWVGLSNRNTGEIDFGMGEVRSTMRILPWSAMELYEVTHPRLNVALGSHGLYVNGEPLPLISFTDPAAANCGAAAPIVVTEHPPANGLWGLGLAMKVFGGLALGGPFGAGAGLIWGLAEHPYHYIRLDSPVGPAPDSVSNTGFVIYPKDKPPPGVVPGDPTRSAEWKSEPLDIGDRHYDFTVDRARQPLWGEDPEGHGYTGRWGPRVEGDLRRRRSGMSFPKFWELFFSSLVRADPPSRTIVLTTESGSTWQVPADWNNAANSIECIGGGGGGGGGTVLITSGSGGTGGTYAKKSNVSFAVNPGGSVTIQIGKGGSGGGSGTNGSNGGDTFIGGAGLAASLVGANGGTGGNANGAAVTAVSTNSQGTTINAGGNSNAASSCGGGGGSGAGGPNGVGGAGGSSSGPGGGAGGGGNGGGAAGENGTPSTIGATGGNSTGAIGVPGKGGSADLPNGSDGKIGAGGGGGTRGTSVGGSGGAGGDGQEFDPAHGSGGGGGGGTTDNTTGASNGTGGGGGLYGGGGGGGGASPLGGAAGGAGAAGLIVIRYTPP